MRRRCTHFRPAGGAIERRRDRVAPERGARGAVPLRGRLGRGYGVRHTWRGRRFAGRQHPPSGARRGARRSRPAGRCPAPGRAAPRSAPRAAGWDSLNRPAPRRGCPAPRISGGKCNSLDRQGAPARRARLAGRRLQIPTRSGGGRPGAARGAAGARREAAAREGPAPGPRWAWAASLPDRTLWGRRAATGEARCPGRVGPAGNTRGLAGDLGIGRVAIQVDGSWHLPVVLCRAPIL